MSEAAHPATPLIVEAEGTPGFHFETARVERLLAVASQLEPAALPAPWVTRLALRYADVLIQTGALDRAATWLGTAEAKLEGPAARVEHAASAARLCVRREDAVGARRALRLAEQAIAESGGGPEAARLAIAHAEMHALRGVYGPVIPLLEPELQRAGAFTRIDDLWRAQRLLATAHRNRLHFERAAELFEAVGDLCAAHDAPRDRSEALMTRGQCLMGVGQSEAAMAALREAQRLAPSGTLTHKDATAALLAGWMAEGDGEQALETARALGIELAKRDNARGYLETVGLVTHLHRIRGEHAAAYRMLLGVYGLVKQRFGDDATRPIVALIDRLKGDLGPQRFEAMAAELLAEMKARRG